MKNKRFKSAEEVCDFINENNEVKVKFITDSDTYGICGQRNYTIFYEIKNKGKKRK